VLVRIGAGRLIGSGMAIVTHRGRHSGRLYQTAVQVLAYDEATGEISVVAWSGKADWYRNIEAAPAVEVWHSGRRYKPLQRLLTKDEIADRLLAQRTKHRFQAQMRRLFIPAPRTEVEAHEYAQTTGGVVFRPAA
jgi:deazaflavin-dependent oxidoreductase (nitroreductase family)